MRGEESAFPLSSTEHVGFTQTGDKIYQTVHSGGLTKREYFAAMAMQGILAGRDSNIEQREYRECDVAYWAVSQADEILKQLDNEKI